jgi:hypothetical protein
MSRPDIVRQVANGWTEEIKISKAFRPDGSQARIRKLVDPNGVTREVWHEVIARDGTILHQHQKPIVRRRPP